MATFLSLLPIFVGGLAGIFYSIDPEVMYVGNALSYIKVHQIQYIDHPGTPSILAIANLLWPLRIYAKLIAKTPFVLWSFEHYDLIFFYLRIIQGVILGVSVFIFLRSVDLLAHSRITLISAFLALFVFTPMLRLGSGITPEGISFLMISIWLFFLAKFINKPGMSLILILGLVAGLAVANKFTNLFFIPASMILVLNLELSPRQKLINYLITLSMVLIGFIVGTWPIRDKYYSLFGWVTKLVTSTGLHAGGKIAIFDWPSYKESFLNIYHQEPWLILGAGLVLLLSILQKRLYLLASIFFLGVLVFAKYPLTYYQLGNYLVIAFLFLILISRINKVLPIFFVLLFLLPFKTSVSYYLTSTTKAIEKTVALERFIKDHQAKKATLWEWGRAKDAAILWNVSSSWHGSIFAAEKEKLRPLTFELYPIPPEQVFSLCWDKLYIQKTSAEAFLKRYSVQELSFSLIQGSDDMFLIESNHCDS